MKFNVNCQKVLILLIVSLFVTLESSFGQYKWEPTNNPPYSFENYSDKFTNNQMAAIKEPGKVLYVSLTGKDSNKGTKNAPFKTLEAARDAIRILKNKKGLPKGGVHVVVLDGFYQINNALVLNEEDSGTKDSPIIYRAENSQKVVLSGGFSLDPKRFSVVKDASLLERLNSKGKGKIISIDLSSDKLASYFPGEGKYGQISMNGHMLQIAQWPNRGYHHIKDIVEKGPTTRWLKPGEKPHPYTKENPTGGTFTFQEELSPAIQKEFERSRDMRAQGYFHNDWYFQDEPVGKIDSEIIQLLHHTRYGIEAKIKSLPRRVRLLNVLAELDEPGEWYFDKHEQRLFVWPIKGFNPETSSVTVIGNSTISANNSFMQPGKGKRQSGSSIFDLKNTSYITLQGFIIESTGTLAASINGGEYNLLAGNVFRNGAGKGVAISGGKHNGITGCDFYDLYNAFSMAGGNFTKLEWSHHFATNNVIRNCRIRGYGVVSLSGVGIHFAHNLLHSMNGAVMYRTVNLLMEYNEFYHIGYEMGDFNVAYCGAQWYTLNNVVRYNFVHHLLEPGGHPVMAFRNDDNGAGLNIYGNVFYRSGRGSAQGDGPLNTCQNNINLISSVMWWTLKKPITPKGIKKQWDDLSRFGTELPKGDKGDYLYIVESVIGKKAWEKSPWIDSFPQFKAVIETNPWAQTFGNVSLNYAYKINEEFHIHGGDGTVEGMESKELGQFKDLPKTGFFKLPEPITLDAFIDVNTLNFSFKEDFKPMEGFKPIPFDNIGLVKDQFRTNPPNKEEYRKMVYERFKDDPIVRYKAEIVNSRYPIPAYMSK